MSPTVILALQSALITLQIINAGIATLEPPPIVPLLVSAVLGGFQFFVHQVAAKQDPPKK